MDASYLGHLANVMFALAYLVKDILWLRLISMAACFIMIFFNYFAPQEPLWVAIFWNSAFILVNAIRSLYFLLERRQTLLSDIEKELYGNTFRHMSPVDFSKVLKTGTWNQFNAGTMILEEGKKPESLILLFNGSAKVIRRNDKRAIELTDGAFIGEMSIITDGVASANVTAASEIKAFCWPRAKLEKLFRDNPNLKASFQLVMAADMARKLKTVG